MIRQVRRVFKDPDIERLFHKSGYVTVPLLDEDDILLLLNTHRQLEPDKPEAFYTSIWHNDPQYRIDVNTAIESIIPGKLSGILDNYKPVFGNFMVKKSRENSALDFHQDWTFVDEDRFIAVNVWIPLQDTNKINGALRIVPGSHKFSIPYRGRNIEGPFWHLSKYIRKYFSELLEVKKGHAVIFDERLIHGSFDNKSDTDRIAVSNVMVPAEAQILHFFKKEAGETIHKYMVNKDFFTRYALYDDISGDQEGEYFKYRIQHYNLWRFARDYFTANYLAK